SLQLKLGGFWANPTPPLKMSRRSRRGEVSPLVIRRILTLQELMGLPEKRHLVTRLTKRFSQKKPCRRNTSTHDCCRFPQRSRKPSVDEQFARFVEVIQKIHINVPLLDAMQVPTYASYLNDILNNKRPLPTTEVVKLTEQCSNVILHKLP
ncbi:Os09g0122300, partial [Oryza sativa Japonica Group]